MCDNVKIARYFASKPSHQIDRLSLALKWSYMPFSAAITLPLHYWKRNFCTCWHFCATLKMLCSVFFYTWINCIFEWMYSNILLLHFECAYIFSPFNAYASALTFFSRILAMDMLSAHLLSQIFLKMLPFVYSYSSYLSKWKSTEIILPIISNISIEHCIYGEISVTLTSIQLLLYEAKMQSVCNTGDHKTFALHELQTKIFEIHAKQTVLQVQIWRSHVMIWIYGVNAFQSKLNS